MKDDQLPLTPDLLLRAYARGIFPMAESRDSDEIFWVDPRERGILPLDGFHLSRSLRRRMRSEPFRVSFDSDFAGVVAGCADRPETWINDEIASLYRQLHQTGHAHSVELHEGETLVGGVYGVTLGAAFFGESMFSKRTDASKIALAYLTDRLRTCAYQLFDTQFLTPHLATLGAVEVPRDVYRYRLRLALPKAARFASGPVDSPDQTIQRMTHTS